MANQWRGIAKEIKQLGDLPAEIARLRAFERFVPLGHYYSPEVTPEELVNRAAELFAPPQRDVPGVNLRVAEQLALIEKIGPQARRIGLPAERDASGADNAYRYWYRNEFFHLPDALALAGVMLEFRPARVVEIGSGFSSAVMLDTRERGGLGGCKLTFIEPYPQERLNELLRPSDRANAEVLETFVQRTPMSTFDKLEANDVLFIDSSHVSKIGSDVNHLFFNVLPRLRPGVLVHVHDVFADFEYPRHWLEEGRRWNEDYLLRAFLQFNDAFEIILFNNYLGVHEHDRFARAYGLDPAAPPVRPEDHGASIWMRKTK